MMKAWSIVIRLFHFFRSLGLGYSFAVLIFAQSIGVNKMNRPYKDRMDRLLFM